jgi:hypothetical protein
MDKEAVERFIRKCQNENGAKEWLKGDKEELRAELVRVSSWDPWEFLFTEFRFNCGREMWMVEVKPLRE